MTDEDTPDEIVLEVHSSKLGSRTRFYPWPAPKPAADPDLDLDEDSDNGESGT